MTVKNIFVLGLAIFLFSGWGLERANAQEKAPSKTPAADELTLTGKMLKGMGVSPARKEKPYPAPEVKKPGAKDKPYPAPELKKPAAPKKPTVDAPLPPTPPVKTVPTAPVPAPVPGGSKTSKDEGY